MFRNLLFGILFVVLLLAFATAVLAQDVTAEPTIVVTVEPPPPVDEPSVPIPDDAIILTGGELLMYLGLAVFAGGGILAVIYRFLDNRDVRDRFEKVYLGASPEQQQILHRVIEGYEETNRRILDFAKAVTDGLPNLPPTTQRRE